MRKIKVLFHSAYNHARMGGQKSLLALIDNMDRERIVPFLVMPNDGELRQLAEERNVTVILMSIPGFKPTNIFKLRKVRDEFIRFIEENDINLIHSDNDKFSYFSTFISKETSAKSIYHARVTDGRKYDKLLGKRIDKIIGISEATKNRFPNIELNKKFRVIYNGVDCEQFNNNYDKLEVRNKLNLEKDKKLLLFVGQIKESKGLVDLLHALKDLDNPDLYKLYILGSEPEEGKQRIFDNLVNKLELNTMVSFVGQKSNVNEWLQASDILLFPSHEGAEGMGRVPFEAMATATPVIATNISGVNEAVNDEVGILVEQEKPDQIAEAVKKLMSDEMLYNKLAANGRKRALELFDIKVHAKNMMELFEEMVNENEN